MKWNSEVPRRLPGKHFYVRGKKASGLLVTCGPDARHESESRFPDASLSGLRPYSHSAVLPQNGVGARHPQSLKMGRSQSLGPEGDLHTALRAPLSARPGELQSPESPAVPFFF